MPLTKEQETEFLCAFASAMLAWQNVEGGLFLIFNNLFRHDKTVLVSAAFYAVVSVDARLAMVNESNQGGDRGSATKGALANTSRMRA